MEVFITKRNLDRITKSVDLSIIRDSELYDKKIDFLSKEEIAELLKIKSAISGNININLYKQIEEVKEEISHDNLVFTYKKTDPTYHFHPQCDRLNSDFINYVIPSSISTNAELKANSKGYNDLDKKKYISQEGNKFRAWFKANINLLKEDEESFVRKMKSHFMINDGINEVRSLNTGKISFTNFNLSELKISIDLHIRKANEFLRKYNNRGIIYLFNSISNNKELDESNNTNLSNEELETFYNQYDSQFKKPIKELLKQYYMVKFNPELSFDGNLLDKLGFRSCSSCSNTVELENVA